MKDEYKEPPALKPTDFEKMFQYKTLLPTNFDLVLKEQEENKAKLPEDFKKEYQPKVKFSINIKF